MVYQGFGYTELFLSTVRYDFLKYIKNEPLELKIITLSMVYNKEDHLNESVHIKIFNQHSILRFKE